MDIALTVALISAGVSLVSVAVTGWSAVATARLQDRMARRRQAESRDEQLDNLVRRYRDPLLLAAFDLQSRLFNIVRGHFLMYLTSGDQEDQEYVRDNTVFLLAQFFGWVEAMRVDVQFLDLGDLQRTRRLRQLLDAVRTAFATDKLPDQRLRIFWGRQRAIGELMVDQNTAATDPTRPARVLGFAAFTARLRTDDTFTPWFSRLAADLVSAANDPAFDPTRLVRAQHALIDLIDFLDDPPVRFPQAHRTKVTS